MDQHPQDPAVPGTAVTGRARGLRQVRRWSNWTAAALIAASVLTTGYFARASQHGRSGTAVAPAAARRDRQPVPLRARQQPCVSVPVATSGGSGVTKQTVIQIMRNGHQRPRADHHGPDTRRRDS